MWRVLIAAALCLPELPAAKDAFGGTYQGEKAKIELKQTRGSRYEGVLYFGGRTFPVTARADKASLAGTFTDEDRSFPFTATLDGGNLRFATGGVTYVLARRPAVNPLATPPPPPAKAPAANDANLHRTASGASFRVPEGWTVKDGDGGAAAVLPPGTGAGGAPAEEIYAVTSHEGYSGADDPKLLEQLRRDLASTGLLFDRAGEKTTFAESGRPVTVLTWELKNPETGVPMMIRFFLTESAGRVQSLIAIAARDRVLGWDAPLRQIAANMKYVPGPKPAADEAPTTASRDDDSLVRTWTARLSGMLLTQMSGGAGFSSRKVLHLSADGAFTYSGNALVSASVGPYGEAPSVSGSSGSRQASSGRWRIVARGGQALLELTLEDGSKNLLPLTMQGDATYLDGVRTYVTAPK